MYDSINKFNAFIAYAFACIIFATKINFWRPKFYAFLGNFKQEIVTNRKQTVQIYNYMVKRLIYDSVFDAHSFHKKLNSNNP